jgi:hypothetical protein
MKPKEPIKSVVKSCDDHIMCLECGSLYIKKFGSIIEKEKGIGEYNVDNVEYYECKKCGDRMYSHETCKILDKARRKIIKDRA